VAAVIWGRGTVASAAVERATKIRPKPTPCHIWGQKMSQNPTSSVRRDNSQNEKALTPSPAATNTFGPNRLYSRPPMGITTAMARLRGISASPDFMAV